MRRRLPDAVHIAGGDRRDHVAVAVCALLDLRMRRTEELGIATEPAYFAETGMRLHDRGPAGLLDTPVQRSGKLPR